MTDPAPATPVAPVPAPRRATPEDLPELVRLRAVALTSLGVDPGPADAPWREVAHAWFTERLTARPDHTCLVIGGGPGERLEACGLAWVTYHLPGPLWTDGRRGYLDGIVTDTGARGKGYGRRIVSGLVDWLNARGLTYIQLHASTDGKPLYSSLGFTPSQFLGMDLHTSPPGAGTP
ncbi:GNAT family N-acetyltransferase [Streptomyces sp. NPDC101132]|uniref:GNAT family N-acetyltransferase n=1 Tax=Streptomyces sp. NPDC101132 TaxID=3366110 RepID=UPI003825ABC5